MLGAVLGARVMHWAAVGVLIKTKLLPLSLQCLDGAKVS